MQRWKIVYLESVERRQLSLLNLIYLSVKDKKKKKDNQGLNVRFGNPKIAKFNCWSSKVGRSISTIGSVGPVTLVLTSDRWDGAVPFFLLLVSVIAEDCGFDFGDGDGERAFLFPPAVAFPLESFVVTVAVAGSISTGRKYG